MGLKENSIDHTFWPAGRAFFVTAFVLVVGQSLAQGPKYAAKLQIKPTMLDFAGSRATGTMYMPSMLQLSAKKPSIVRKEPDFTSKTLYSVVMLGNGPHAAHAVALEEPASGDPKLFVDVKGNGDLTTGGNGAWQQKTVVDGIANYQTTVVMRASYGTASHETSSSPYGLNFYWSIGRKSLSYYRAGERVGTINVDGNSYSVAVIENNNNAVFNEPYVVNGKPTKSIWLVLNGVMIDARGTFPWKGMNFQAKLSPSGSRITLQPTYRAVTAPPAPAPTQAGLLAVGATAPNFEVPKWGGGTIRLSSLRGKIVVLDFWATWCGPCKASLPHLEHVYQEVKGKNVYVLALNVFDNQTAYDHWIPANPQYKFHFALDPAGRGAGSIASSLYNVTGIPTTYIIGPDGRVAASIVGFAGLNDHRLEQALAQMNVAIAVPGATKKTAPMIGLGGGK